MSANILDVHDIAVSFGGHRALTGVNIGVAPGQLIGLIGPNGAGKTTLFNVITGLLSPSKGRVCIDGRNVNTLDPFRRTRLGLARTFQRLELFTDLTVRDNLRVAGEARRSWDRGRSRSDVDEHTDRVLELVGLGEVADALASTVPTGTARRVELGRALMLRPRILLLDEPASGQSDEETHRFEILLRELVERDGLSIVLVEHDMSLVMKVCDRIHVLDFGELIAAGTPAEVQADPRVRDAYLGAAS